MDAQRALLDQLMGADRNLQPSERSDRKRKFSDREVDKMYLVGCSPYELFAGSKSDLGPNPKIPDDDCKLQWESLTDAERDRYGYEMDTKVFLENLLKKLDKKIDQNKQRCRVVDSSALEATAQSILDKHGHIEVLFSQIDPLAKRGEVARAFQIHSQVQLLREGVKDLLGVPDAERRLFVCETTGNMIARADTDERLRSHFEGRQYQGWNICRQKLVELSAKQLKPNARSSNSDSWRWDTSDDRRRHTRYDDEDRRHRRSRSRDNRDERRSSRRDHSGSRRKYRERSDSRSRRHKRSTSPKKKSRRHRRERSSSR